jgi:ribonuclease E
VGEGQGRAAVGASRGEPRRGRRGVRAEERRGGRAQGRQGEGEGERGEGRGGELTSGIQLRRSPSPKPRAPRERERDGGEREVAAWEKSNEENGSGGGGRMGWAGAPGVRGPGRAGPGWAGLGHIADRNPRHARPLNGLQSRTENRNGTRRTRDIRQRNALRHDATPMTLRFCLYMTRTLVTILV